MGVSGGRRFSSGQARLGWVKASAWLVQTPSPFLRRPYPEGWSCLSKVRDLLGDSGQTYFMAKLQGPRVTDGRLGTAKGHPCRRKQPGPPPLQVPTARSSCGYPTGIDPGPEGQDPVRKGQLWQQGICPVTT